MRILLGSEHRQTIDFVSGTHAGRMATNKIKSMLHIDDLLDKVLDAPEDFTECSDCGRGVVACRFVLVRWSGQQELVPNGESGRAIALRQ